MTTSPNQTITIRAGLQTGDIGYVTYLHGILYAQEYNYDTTFDGYVALGMGEFAKDYDPAKDCIWIAAMGDQIVGSISIVGQPDNMAQLRWFIVHPAARGQGLGHQLMDQALAFCRDRGFKSIYLWTVDYLGAAIHLYTSAEFTLTEEQTHELWGQTLTEQRYDLILSGESG